MPNKSKQERRLNLFDTFAKNLNIINPKYPDIFVCPLCYREFTKDKIDSDLSLAHVWPEKLGGKLETLACRICNTHTIGSTLEPHLINFIQNPHKERIFINQDRNKSLGIKSKLVDENEIFIEVIPEISNTQILDWRVREGNPFTIEMRETFRWDRVELTYLHFAYLYLFHNFGYEWIFTPFAQKIHHQLNNPDKQTFQTFLSEVVIESLPNYKLLQDESPYSFVIIKPKERIGFAVASPKLENLPNHRMLVLLFLANPNIHVQESADKILGETLSLGPALDLDKVHKLILGGDAPHLSRKTVFTFLLHSGVVQNEKEAHQLIKASYFP